MEKDLNEHLANSCGFDWGAICAQTKDKHGHDVLTFPNLKPLMFVYKKEEDEPYYNREISATSIKIKSSNIAQKVFDFTPQFINYHMA